MFALSRSRATRASRLLTSAAAAALLVAAPLTASAQGKPDRAAASKAADLKRAGDEAMQSLHYADALAAYEQSFALSSDPALLYNRGRALQALSRFPEALAMLEAFREQAPQALKAKVPRLDELVDEVRARVSTLRVTSAPAGAVVTVRSQRLGAAPLEKKVNAGAAVVEIEAEGFVPMKREVDLKGGEVVTIEATLVARDARGTLSIRTDPPGSLIEVDGKPLGASPVEARLEPGNVDIVARHKGYREVRTQAVVGSGDQKMVDLVLEKEPGITSRWWFWASVGAVVLGGAALTAALLTEKKASRGDLDPGQVAAPLVRF